MSPTTHTESRVGTIQGAARAEDAFEIEVGGRKAFVFRPLKNGARLRKYYVKFRIAGKQVYKGLGVDSAKLAKPIATKILRAAIGGRWAALATTNLRQARAVPTLCDVIAAYEGNVRAFSLTIEPSVVVRNTGSLRRACAHALDMFEASDDEHPRARRAVDQKRIDRLPSTILTEELVEKFFVKYVAAAGANLVERDARIRGGVSTLRQARSLFAKNAMKAYRGMELPSVNGFMNAVVPHMKPPPQVNMSLAVIQEMASAVLPLREEEPPLYLAHLCFRHLGMRNDEIENARVEWLEYRPGEVWLPSGEKREIAGYMVIKTRPYWEPKQSEGEVPIAPDVWAEIQRLTAGRSPDDHLIAAATATDRAELINRRHANLVRRWTATSRKKSYELRRWGYTLVADRQGDEFGDRFIRHKPRSVGGRFYRTHRTPPAPITFADCGLTEVAGVGAEC